jgi:hypothetical protein
MRRSVAIVAAGATLIACQDAPRASDAVRAVADRSTINRAPIDPTRAMDVARHLSSSAFQSLKGTCIRTDPGNGSRILYTLLPSETAYVRLNVVASNQSLALVEFVRGASGGRIWTAAWHPSSGTPVTMQTFASASDHSPLTLQSAADGREAQLLRSIAAAAIALPCATP